jgi:hypothetical protein
MAHTGTGYFDRKGQYFENPDQASISDLATLLGRIGEGESLAEGIAHLMLQKRAEIIAIFADHEAMLVEQQQLLQASDEGNVVTPLRPAS